MSFGPNFVVNRNGNTANDIRNDFGRAYDACQTLQTYLGEIHANALHGRNYQTLENGAELSEDDRETLRGMMASVNQIAEFAMNGAVRAILCCDGL